MAAGLIRVSNRHAFIPRFNLSPAISSPLGRRDINKRELVTSAFGCGTSLHTLANLQRKKAIVGTQDLSIQRTVSYCKASKEFPYGQMIPMFRSLCKVCLFTTRAGCYLERFHLAQLKRGSLRNSTILLYSWAPMGQSDRLRSSRPNRQSRRQQGGELSSGHMASSSDRPVRGRQLAARAGSPVGPTASACDRSQVRVGALVDIILKEDQSNGRLTRGTVSELLTNSRHHPRGIKVRLKGGAVGRVHAICSAPSGGGAPASGGFVSSGPSASFTQKARFGTLAADGPVPGNTSPSAASAGGTSSGENGSKSDHAESAPPKQQTSRAGSSSPFASLAGLRTQISTLEPQTPTKEESGPHFSALQAGRRTESPAEWNSSEAGWGLTNRTQRAAGSSAERDPIGAESGLTDPAGAEAGTNGADLNLELQSPEPESQARAEGGEEPAATPVSQSDAAIRASSADAVESGAALANERAPASDLTNGNQAGLGPSSGKNGGVQIFVSNMSKKVTKNEFAAAMRAIPGVVHWNFLSGHQGQCRGYAFCSAESLELAPGVVEAVKQVSLHGRRLRAKLSVAAEEASANAIGGPEGEAESDVPIGSLTEVLQKAVQAAQGGSEGKGRRRSSQESAASGDAVQGLKKGVTRGQGGGGAAGQGARAARGGGELRGGAVIEGEWEGRVGARFGRAKEEAREVGEALRGLKAVQKSDAKVASLGDAEMLKTLATSLPSRDRSGGRGKERQGRTTSAQSNAWVEDASKRKDTENPNPNSNPDLESNPNPNPDSESGGIPSASRLEKKEGLKTRSKANEKLEADETRGPKPSQPITGEMILAAMQRAAAEKAKAAAKREKAAARARGDQSGPSDSEESDSEGPVKPIEVRPEWASEISNLRARLRELKQMAL